MSPLPCVPSDDNCPICGRYKVELGRTQSLIYTVSCQLCGRYNFSERLIEAFARTKPNYIISGITRNHWENTNTELLISCETFESLEAFIKQAPVEIPDAIDIPAKSDFVLKHIRRQTEFPGSTVDINLHTDFSLGFCKNPNELKYLLSYLVSLKHVTNVPLKESPLAISYQYQITPSGWAYLSGIGADSKEQGFIAMAFKLALKLVSDCGIYPGIENAGYKPLRIDSKDHNNRIDDEIVAEIRKSKFVVADLTGKNAGAYFEAGFAMGLGKPVIWTCQQSDIDKKGGIHFDTRQYSIVSWEPDKLVDFAKRLTQRIEATIGHGQYVPESSTK